MRVVHRPPNHPPGPITFNTIAVSNSISIVTLNSVSNSVSVCVSVRLSMDEVDSVKASIAEASLNNTKPNLEREAAAEALRQATLQNEQLGEEMQQLKAKQANRDHRFEELKKKGGGGDATSKSCSV